jgi:glycerate-2-kinase
MSGEWTDAAARGAMGAARLDACTLLAAHDSYAFFDRIEYLVRTGPTLTNVNRAVLIGAGTARKR